MEKRYQPQRRHEPRRAEDEAEAKALNDLLEVVREEAEHSIDWRTCDKLRDALTAFATTRRPRAPR